jgi:hypothetical protein
MRNRIGRYCGATSDVARANATMAFCAAIWELYTAPSALQDSEIDALLRLEYEAAAVLCDSRIPLPWGYSSFGEASNWGRRGGRWDVGPHSILVTLLLSPSLLRSRPFP